MESFDSEHQGLRLKQIALGVLPEVRKVPEEEQMVSFNLFRGNLFKILALSKEETDKKPGETGHDVSDESDEISPVKSRGVRSRKKKNVSSSSGHREQKTSPKKGIKGQRPIGSAKSESSRQIKHQMPKALSKQSPISESAEKLKNIKRRNKMEESTERINKHGTERKLFTCHELPQLDVVTMVSQVSVSDNETEADKRSSIKTCQDPDLSTTLRRPSSPCRLQEKFAKQPKRRRTKKRASSMDNEQRIKESLRKTGSLDEKQKPSTVLTKLVKTNRTHQGLLNKNDFSARPGEQGSESPSENSKVFGHVRSENSSKKPLRPMTSPSTNDEMTRSSRPSSQSRGLFNKVLSDAELKSSQESEDMKLKEKSQTVMDLCRNLSVSIGQPGVVNSFTKCETSLLSYQEMQEISIPENELKGSAKECWLVHRRLKVEGVHVPLNVLQRALMTPTEIRELTHSCSQYDFGERSKLLSSNNNE
ncbi:uncharacterized protein LOC143243828 [Tachypleus tridentatus]|uniref:uncharacterized protein LOC143243828 n=1 Tax=Tachypleus tridentatus TaxID=6853 RepID=UPI003FD5BF76